MIRTIQVYEIDESWDRFVSGHPDGTIFHRSVWRRIVAPANGVVGVFLRGARGDIDLLVVRADGTPAGRSASTESDEAVLVPVRAGEPVYVKVHAYRAEGDVPFLLWWAHLGDRRP